MDIFDSDAYFGRHFPFKAQGNLMLRAAVAAVAAKQIAQMIENEVTTTIMGTLSPVFKDVEELESIDWYYKAANYYDAGISFLRLYIQRHCDGAPPPRLTTQSTPSSSHERQEPDHMSSEDRPQHSECQSPPVFSPEPLEDLLSAIAVFSHYEALNGYAEGWRQ